MHWSSFSQIVNQKHCSEPKNGLGGENGGWCIGDALRKEKKYHFIYVYNLNFFDEIKKDKNLHRVKGKTKKKTKITINSPNK